MSAGAGQRRWIDQRSTAGNAADLLFEWLATDPAAARLFVRRVADHPELLFLTAHDDRSVADVLSAGTDPSVMSIVESGQTIRPLIDWATTHDTSLAPDLDGGVENIRSVMATAVGPWLMQFSSRADDWSWTASEADGALRWTIGDQTAAAELAVSMEGWQRVLANTRLIDAEGRVDDSALRDLAGMFAALQVALHDEEIADTVAAGFWSDNVVPFGAILVSAMVPGGPVINALADLTLAATSPTAQRWLQQNGVLRERDDATAVADARFSTRSASTQVIAVVGAVGRLIDEGKLPPDTLEDLQLDDPPPAQSECESEEVDARLHQFISGLAASTDPTTYDALLAVTGAFGNSLVDRTTVLRSNASIREWARSS